MSSAVVACSLVTSLDDLIGVAPVDDSGAGSDGSSDGDATNGSDAGSSNHDAGPEEDAPVDAPLDVQTMDADAPPPLPPNLAPDPDFEGAESLCSGNNTFRASATLDGVAHAGARSCRVCNTSGTSGGYSFDFVGDGWAAARVGDRFIGEAWVRAAPGGPDVEIVLQFRIYDAQGNDRDDIRSGNVQVGASWVKVQVNATATVAGHAEIFVVSSIVSPRSCFLVDDISLRRQP